MLAIEVGTVANSFSFCKAQVKMSRESCIPHRTSGNSSIIGRSSTFLADGGGSGL